jgi:precorrin-6A/cobalt-precorrin-6A reductase
MNILILGGTALAKQLAQALSQVHGIHVTYSIAGRVRQPNLNCTVISGGFSQYAANDQCPRFLKTSLADNNCHHDGLFHVCKQQAIDLIIDATHAFAEAISRQAWQTSITTKIPFWRLHHLPWPTSDALQRWQYESMEGVLEAVTQHRINGQIFLALGQLDKSTVDALSRFSNSEKKGSSVSYLLRSIHAPVQLPERCQWISDIGPFDLSAEIALLKQHNVQAIICKNSGATSSEAKLTAATELNIPVFMLARPTLHSAQRTFSELSACLRAVQHFQDLNNAL